MRYLTVWKTVHGQIVWGYHGQRIRIPVPPDDELKSRMTYAIAGQGPVYVAMNGEVQTELPVKITEGMVR